MLFYGEKANKLKDVPYRRVRRNYIVLPLVISMLVALGLFTNILRQILKEDGQNIYSYHYGIATIISIASGMCVYFIAKKIIYTIANSGIKHISLKDIEVDLSDEKPDFKQLLDSLIEYFRITKRKIIIFEDFDRYKEWRIFEELKNLNLAINSSDYFKKDKNKIIFVYATSGKIFDTPADKNKIFDATVPIVPFMSASNSSFLFAQELNSLGLNPNKPSAIVGSMSSFIPDARVLRAITNRFIEYVHIFDPEEKEYGNLISLAIIAELLPEEFDELTRNESTLDSIRIKGQEEKSRLVKEIESKYSTQSLIKTNEKSLHDKIMNFLSESDSVVEKVEVEGSVFGDITADAVCMAIEKYSSVIITAYDSRFGTRRKEIVNNELRQIVKEVSPLALDQELALEKTREEIIDTNKKDSLTLGLPLCDLKDMQIVERLIETESIKQSYVDYVAKSELCPKRDLVSEFINYAVRQRSESYNYYYPVQEFVEELILELQETDYLSPGILNFDLFDYLIKNNIFKKDNFMKLASIHENEVLDFCVSYFEYSIRKNPLTSKNNYFVFLLETIIDNDFELAIKLINKMRKKDDATGSALFGFMLTHRKLENEEVKICASLPDFASYIRNGMNEDATDNAIRCHLDNGARIEKLLFYSQESQLLQSNISSLKIFLNIENIHEMKTAILNNYISSHNFTYGELDDILNHGDINDQTIEIVLDKLNSIEGDSFNDAIANLYKKTKEYGIGLSIEHLKFIVKGLSNNEVERIILDRCDDAQEVKEILYSSKKEQFKKIVSKGRIIRIDNTKTGQKFAQKLKGLGLVSIINEKNNKYLESAYIYLKVLNDDESISQQV